MDLSLVGNKKALASIIGAPGIANDEDLGILDVFKELMLAGIRRKAKIWPQRFATIELGNPAASASLLVIAHADTNGLRVSKITEDGFLRFQTVGGTSSAHYLSQVVFIWSRFLGKKMIKIPGVVGWKALHHLGDKIGTAPKPEELAIDIGAKNKSEAESLGIRIGDPITFESKITYFRNGLVAANGLDNRSGVWCVIETLYGLYKDKEDLDLHIVFAISGKEEIGLVGAQQIEGTHNKFNFCVGFDVDFANDYPGAADLKSGCPEISLGKGPTISQGSIWDRRLQDDAIDLAKHKNIPYQVGFAGGGMGTDAAYYDRKGVRTIHFGIPCRYMHFKEMVSLDDLKNTAHLAAELIKKISGR